MTLTEKIEGAREALNDVATNCISFDSDKVSDALAALPDKPMTEEGVIKIIEPYLSVIYSNAEAKHGIIRALKAANVLYIAE